MRVLVMVESCILVLATGTALAWGLSAPPMPVRPIGVYVCPSDPGIEAIWPVRCLIREAALSQVQPFAVTRVGIGPLIDMDSTRRHDEDRDKKRNEQLREQARRNEELRGHHGNYPKDGSYHGPRPDGKRREREAWGKNEHRRARSTPESTSR